MQLEPFFNKLDAHLEKNLPFVCFTTKNGLKSYLQNSSDICELERYKASGFVFVPFAEDHPSVLLPSDSCEINEYHGELTESVLKTTIKNRRIPFDHIDNESDKLRHEALVSDAIHQIKTTSLQKVICSRLIKVRASIHLISTFKRMVLKYPNAFCYCWHHPKVGTWLGATPEQFINLDRGVLKTVALAGTQHKEEFPKANWTRKEFDEQKMVTDYIVETLTKNSSDLKVGKVETVSAGNLWHLKTEISAKVDVGNLGNIITTLHPTPAVCGMPKKEAKVFIQEHEAYDRMYYSGFLGELNVKVEKTRSQRHRNQENQVFLSIKTCSNLYVNLRCMQIFEDSLHLYVGGGITKDSNPLDEYLETKAKSQTLLNVI